MIQEILVWVIFGVASLWLGYKYLWPKKKADSGCGAGCSCSASPSLNVDKIEADLKKRKEFAQ